MKILVTGHRGFIGGKIYNTLVSQGHDVDGIDLKEGKDIFFSLPTENYDFVFHLAAFPSVEFCYKNPFHSIHNNVLGTSKILNWARNHGVKRVIFSSSAAVNGGSPKSPYGLHKFMNEMECRLYSQLYGLDTVCLRYFNVYSEDQEFGGPYSTAICAWTEMIRQGKPLRIDGDGEQTRDLVHVEDIVDANIFCMEHEGPFNGKWLNVGSGKSVSMNYIKNYIDLHNKVEWNHTSSRKGDVRHTLADISELQKLGWEPKISIEEGLARCFKRS